ncbi:hypothetical protein [Flaviaesturariibacter amylovorans]|uniref:Outer membrane protein beta-barrel domain-containing protein n=1 Tax=Flaviaesturariibacter amylovorans TaxID=1084520 RepID=A0ABP8HK56_9BACT
MKKLLLLLIPALPLEAAAQAPDSSAAAPDSLGYYRAQYHRVTQYYDSLLWADTAYQQAVAGLRRAQQEPRTARARGRKGYGSFTVFAGAAHAQPARFNALLAREGFPTVGSLMPYVGIGLGMRDGSLLLDIGFAGGGLHSKRDGRTISASLLNAFAVELGVDLLPARGVSLFPYAGLSYRVARLSYESPEEVNRDATDVTDLVINRRVDVKSRRLGYAAGAGIDVLLRPRNNERRSAILFVKGGVNRPFWKDRFRYKGATLEPGPGMGAWQVVAGIRFARFY